MHGQSSLHLDHHRNKESLALDLKNPSAAPLMDLLDADVLVQNLAPGAAARMGLSWRPRAEHNPN